MKAVCGADEVVIMTAALYGRMHLGRCVQHDLGYVGCFTDILYLADSLCSGRRECQIVVPNAQFHQLQPCLKELMVYFQSAHICQKG